MPAPPPPPSVRNVTGQTQMLLFRHAGKTSLFPPPTGGLTAAIIVVARQRKEYHVVAAVEGHELKAPETEHRPGLERLLETTHLELDGKLFVNTQQAHTWRANCRRFDPGGSLDRRVNCRCVSQPRWVSTRRNTRGKIVRGNHGLVLSCAQGGCACSRGLQAFTRERERARALCVGPFSHAATHSSQSPGPSFYRCKERAQVYNGGCSNVLTCLAKGSQSPMYMPSWLSERCCCPVHVMLWPSQERLSPVEAQLLGLSDPC
jgi:hypothetical protein